MQAAEFEARSRAGGIGKDAPSFDLDGGPGAVGASGGIDWQSRTDPNWAMRLSPFDAVMAAAGDSRNFADFAFKFEGKRDALNFADFGFKLDDEDTKDKAQGYDGLGNELGVSHWKSEEDKVDRSHFAL